jgi:hypothetical protein
MLLKILPMGYSFYLNQRAHRGGLLPVLAGRQSKSGAEMPAIATEVLFPPPLGLNNGQGFGKEVLISPQATPTQSPSPKVFRLLNGRTLQASQSLKALQAQLQSQL